MKLSETFDFIIVGAGIVGLATAWKLNQREPQAKILIVEKESGPAQHQTGHNSGVLHAGVYYKPGSLKARLCMEGKAQIRAFCEQYDLPLDSCGKVLVATDEVDLGRMQDLLARCAQNGLATEVLSQSQLHDYEPLVSGVGGFFVPDSAAVDYGLISQKLVQLLTHANVMCRFNTSVDGIDIDDHDVRVSYGTDSVIARQLIVCGGLYSDRLICAAGLKSDFQIVPFRGEYFELAPALACQVNHMIYPIPDPSLPFLGVHLTRLVDGRVIVGPNAVLALAREGYTKTDFNWGDLQDMLSFSGFWRLMLKQAKTGVVELSQSLFPRLYLRGLQRYCPSITLKDLIPYPAGVRAQAVDVRGNLIDDFVFHQVPRALFVGNAPSPAATSSFAIADYILEQL